MNHSAIFEAIQSERLRTALNYWESKRGERSVPRRSDLELTDIPGLLVNITIADVVDNGADFVMRYVGRGLSGNQAVQPGSSILAMPPEQGRDLILERFRRVLTERRPVYQRYVFSNATTGDHRIVEAVSCPLSDDGETINKLFTCGEGCGLAPFGEIPGDTLI